MCFESDGSCPARAPKLGGANQGRILSTNYLEPIGLYQGSDESEFVPTIQQGDCFLVTSLLHLKQSCSNVFVASFALLITIQEAAPSAQWFPLL
jgi:hypothetical protein